MVRCKSNKPVQKLGHTPLYLWVHTHTHTHMHMHISGTFLPGSPAVSSAAVFCCKTLLTAYMSTTVRHIVHIEK